MERWVFQVVIHCQAGGISLRGFRKKGKFKILGFVVPKRKTPGFGWQLKMLIYWKRESCDCSILYVKK